MKSSLPKFVTKYFWGDDLSELSWEKHRKYITKTLLEKGDRKGTSWLIRIIGKQKLADQIASLKLSSKSAGFWKLYLS